MNSYITQSEQETINLGSEFAKTKLKAGDVVALFGDLGSGKTRFVQGICKGFGITEHVASPSFTIVNEYNTGSLKIYHFDFYRVKSIDEIVDIGFDDYINADGICVIEWAERVTGLLGSRFEVHFSLGDAENIREIKIVQLNT